MFCPWLFGVLFLFDVWLINGQCHYLVFYIWPCIWAGAILVPTFLCGTWCSVNVTILLGVIVIFCQI